MGSLEAGSSATADTGSPDKGVFGESLNVQGGYLSLSLVQMDNAKRDGERMTGTYADVTDCQPRG